MVVTDHELQAALPAYNGWVSTYEYPGSIVYTHPSAPVVVMAASYDRDRILDIQIHAADLSVCLDDGEGEPWPALAERTAEKLFARLKPYLDKYQPKGL